MYGNAPRALWANWSPPDERNRITLACRAFLLETDDGKRILFETGIGVFFEPKLRDRFGVLEPSHMLLDNLARHGVTQESIDAVVLSHLHFDHAGGLLTPWGEGPPSLLFPKAQYFVGEKHWQRALAPHPRDRASFLPELHALLQASGRLVLVGGDGKSSLAPLVQFHTSDGHTPGLLLSELQLPKGPLLFAADLIPGVPWVHVPITMGYDRFPELLIEEKQRLLESLLQRNGGLLFTHDPSVPCGRIQRDEKGKFSAVETPTQGWV